MHENLLATLQLNELELAIRRNAERLLADASLLYEHERYRSACLLAIHAYEEVGKCVLGVWERIDDEPIPKIRYGYHTRKQAALSALYMAEATMEAYKHEIARHGLEMKHISELQDRPNLQSCFNRGREIFRSVEHEVVSNVAKETQKSSILLMGSLSELVEELRRDSLYVDANGERRLYKEVTRKDVANLFIEYTGKGLKLVTDPLFLVTGRVIYVTELERFASHSRKNSNDR